MKRKSQRDDEQPFTIGNCDLCDEPAKWLVDGTKYLCTEHMVEANKKDSWRQADARNGEIK